MQRLADDVWHLALAPRDSVNAYVIGDVLIDLNVLTTRPGLRPPLARVTADPALNRQSMRRIAALEPSLVGFGHGPVVRDAAPKLAAAVAELPPDYGSDDPSSSDRTLRAT